MRALIRSRLAGSPETGAFISFLHMPKPPWSGGTRLEPALGWFPLLLLKAQLKSSKAESNSQQVNIHLQQREDGSGSTEESGCAPGAVPAHVPCPRPHSAILMFVIQDAFSSKKSSKPPASAAGPHSKSLSPVTPLRPELDPPRSHRGAALAALWVPQAVLSPQGGTSLQSMDHAPLLRGKGVPMPWQGRTRPSRLFPPCPKDILWTPVSEQSP